ncbi:hypothetical protein CPC08DRAFT_492180 [Agrocybe pediades]|nr:hypothetical protein CPC08DRAFT_492180 [Agrocybe pediades]
MESDSSMDIVGGRHTVQTAGNLVPPDSAQLRVLRTAELLDLVMSAMDTMDSFWHSPIGRPTSQHLVWAALTCKRFYDPAMNALWKVMDSWEPIMNLIDVVKKSEKPGEKNAGTYITTGLISERNLERMDSYVQRIRHFLVDDYNLANVSPHIYMCLSELRHLRLFPALRALTIFNLGDYDISDILRLWLTPSSTLSEVKITGINAGGVAETLMEKISRISRDIRQISLEGTGFQLALLSDVVERFSNLKELYLDVNDMNVSAHDITTFSRLKNLQDLRLFMDENAQFISSKPFI